MALINPNHPALQGNPGDFWKEELDNSKILLYEINKAIDYLTKNKYARYSVDTGQDNFTVQYSDLPALYTRRDNLLEQIENFENKLGIAPEAAQSDFVVRPV
ncbi:hypothetical protein FACS1894161_4410 [Spirochaetia bacterium]|nr:hypothetical protein FACS1894161_4410 [Spirochaetia bacterium]